MGSSMSLPDKKTKLLKGGKSLQKTGLCLRFSPVNQVTSQPSLASKKSEEKAAWIKNFSH